MNSPSTTSDQRHSGAANWNEISKLILRLSNNLPDLERSVASLELLPLQDQEWYAHLQRKLLPQISRDDVIVVSVVGGTNIGKSAIFNHLADEILSAVSAEASGTIHPICLVPRDFRCRYNLTDFFPEFELRDWSGSHNTMEDASRNLLIVRETDRLPPNLLLLDTPDIDSDAPVNWERADHIRQVSDVLIAVLTQQKYNDAAIKQFFRKGGLEGKSIFVVFNRCQFPLDEEYWPRWLETFECETGISATGIYLAPNDRKRAETNCLPFYRRERLGAQNADQTCDEKDLVVTSLIQEVTRLHFDDVKHHALKCSLELVLNPRTGLPSYLGEIRRRSGELCDLSNRLTIRQLVRVQDWPTVPSTLIVRTIRKWWRNHREGWTRSVHEFYNSIGDGLTAPFRWAYRQWEAESSDPLEAYLRSEREVILASVDYLYQSLRQLRGEEIPWLHRRLNRLLGGAERKKLLQHLGEAHSRIDLNQEIEQIVMSEMNKFETESPQLYTFLKRLDSFAAAARPMTTVALFFAGGVPGIDTLAHETASQLVMQIAGGTGTVVVGETALTGTSSGLRFLEAKFRQLEAAITMKRVTWFADLLRRDLFGDIQVELEKAGETVNSEEYRIASDLEMKLRQAGSCLN